MTNWLFNPNSPLFVEGDVLNITGTTVSEWEGKLQFNKGKINKTGDTPLLKEQLNEVAQSDKAFNPIKLGKDDVAVAFKDSLDIVYGGLKTIGKDQMFTDGAMAEMICAVFKRLAW
jgi:hypothetical protein